MKKALLVSVIPFLVFFSLNVFAQNIIHVPAQYITIQEGIIAASNGDTVLVADGLYYENIKFLGKAITVASHYLVDGDTTHIENTIINGSKPSNPDSGSVVYFLNGEDTTSVICGFTITGGTGTIENVPPPYGQGRVGGGIFSSCGGRVSHNNISYNSVSSINWAEGGGLEFDYTVGPTSIGLVIIENNNIAHNTSYCTNNISAGGGMVIAGLGRIVNNQVTDNTCSTLATQWYALGGGIEGGLSSLVIENNFIARNKALAPNSQQNASFGGGVFYWTTNMQFLNNTVVENLVQSGNNISAYGRGLSFSAGTKQSTILISSNLIANNKVLGGGYSSGGGIGIWDEGARIENNIIVGNSALNGGGVGIRRINLTTEESPTLINNTIAYNRATSGSGGGIVVQGSWTPVVVNTIAWGDTGTTEIALLSGSGIHIFYSDIDGGWPAGSGNINADPLFVNILNNDFHLQDLSPCIETGTDSIEVAGFWFYCPPTDIEGNPRPYPSGTMPDIGAYEYQYPVGIKEIVSSVPTEFRLEQNYPNPFNPKTTLRYSIPNESKVIIKVYDILGNEIETLVNEEKSVGTYELTWNATNLPSGVYFYKLNAGEYTAVKKMLLLK